MASSARPRPWRALLVLIIVMIGLGVWTFWPGKDNAPRLGLDLQGGTQVILVPKSVTGGGDVSPEQLNQAVEIIRQRVNGIGVSEAEVTTQGSGGSSAIVVSVPGVNQQKITEQLATTALLNFRPVVQEDAGGPAVAPEPVTPTPTPPATPTPAKKAKKGSSFPLADPTPAASASPAATAAAAATPGATTPPAVVPGEAIRRPPFESDSNNQLLQTEYAKLDCSNPINHQGGGQPDDPAKWIVTCSKDGAVKYLLEPAFIKGTQVTSATAALPQQGAGGWQVDLSFDSEGASALATVSTKLVSQPPPTNQFAIVLDGLVQSSPYFSEAILGGTASINGNFTVEEAKSLANVLKYGALPVQLTVAEVTTVSPTLGSDQLAAGLLAGAIGLALVVLYLLIYYRALGIVAVISLVVAASITYGIFVIMGRTIGLALTLAGVAGAIVAIGITADSFVVYFERIRDEVRDGKTLRVAVEVGWHRARNTILAADFVSLLAATILYLVSIGNVRGFAFVLGITTLIDIAVAFMFTKPLVTLLARSNWFAAGGSLTGMSMKRLGREDKKQTETQAARHPKRVKQTVGAPEPEPEPDDESARADTLAGDR